MDGWMDNEKRMMVEGERVEARPDDASRLFGCVSQIGQIFQSPTEDASTCRKVQISVNRRKRGSLCTRDLTQILVLVAIFRPREAKSRSQTIHSRANSDVEVNIAPFSTDERRKRGRNDKYV